MSEHESEMIIGLGHPRCGTGFTSGLLKAGGLDVPHEKPGKDGMVSWMAGSGRVLVPWGRSIPNPDGIKEKKVFCVVRSPLKAIPSIIPENQNIRSFAFRSQVIWDKLGIDLASDRRWRKRPVSTAIASYAFWYQVNLLMKPEFIFRIDKPDDDAALGSFVGAEISRDDEIHRNSRPKRRGPEFTTDQLDGVHPTLLEALAELARKFNYVEDAEAIEAFL